MDHRLAYEALAGGLDRFTELYTTDAEIRRFDLVVLEDDLGFFPLYEAVLVYRAGIAPAAIRALKRLEGPHLVGEDDRHERQAQEKVPAGGDRGPVRQSPVRPAGDRDVSNRMRIACCG